MHVKDNRLFVIAYNDLTFDLIDIEQLQTFVKEQEQKDEEGDAVMKDEGNDGADESAEKYLG